MIKLIKRVSVISIIMAVVFMVIQVVSDLYLPTLTSILSTMGWRQATLITFGKPAFT